MTSYTLGLSCPTAGDAEGGSPALPDGPVVSSNL
jgi:hypothetical protein